MAGSVFARDDNRVVVVGTVGIGKVLGRFGAGVGHDNALFIDSAEVVVVGVGVLATDFGDGSADGLLFRRQRVRCRG